jgi:hypothetical protein
MLREFAARSFRRADSSLLQRLTRLVKNESKNKCTIRSPKATRSLEDRGSSREIDQRVAGKTSGVIT